MPRRLGQHFLADRRYRARTTEALRLDESCVVLEIGAGRGALTELLAQRAGLVLAVEVDPPLAAVLRKKFAGDQRVRVVEADILELDLHRLMSDTGIVGATPRGRPGSQIRPTGRPHGVAPTLPSLDRAKVAGNLPYYITSPILLRLFGQARLFEEIVVMVQLEVAERLAARPGCRDYGLLSVTAQYYTRPELLFRIPPEAFQPPPQVDSALVRMRVAPRGGELGIADEAAFFRFLRACFVHKRKTLVNNLKALYGAEEVKAVLEAHHLSSTTRAEQLTLDQFAAVFKELKIGR